MKSQPLVLGADHAGFGLKESLKRILQSRGIEFTDLSPVFHAGDDYPAIAKRVARDVAKLQGGFGVLVCGSGVGVTIAANRVKGVRAFDATDEQTVKLAREHNDANVIALSGWHLSPAKAGKLVRLFLETSFSKTARHRRRVKQLG